MLSRHLLPLVIILSLPFAYIHGMNSQEECFQQEIIIQNIAQQADTETRNAMRQVNHRWHTALLPE